MSRQPTVPELLRYQAMWCEKLGSPLYAQLLERAAVDAEQGGPVARLMEPHAQDPPTSVPTLRLMGAVNRLVLEGEAPAWGSVEPWVTFAAGLAHPRVEELIERPIQTNEVGRTAALVGGFLLVARETGLPLRLLEMGASAGLNLRWDRYRYELGDARWGDPAARTVLAPRVEGPPPQLEPATVEIAERRGCDMRPNDPTTEEGRLTLLSYVWPDQTARLELLRAALDAAPAVAVPVDDAGAGDWVEARLAQPADGVATVVFHSIFWGYVPRPEQERIERALAAAGGRATGGAPLAWLRMEPGGEQTEVRLTTWPGGEERVLAAAGYHGSPLRRLGG